MGDDRYTRTLSIMSGRDRSITGRLARAGLAAAEPAYRLTISLRNLLFNNNIRTIQTLPRKAISVGNITTGGTGKTPMVIELARRLVEAGRHPVVLLRGYKSGPAGSDEARMIAEDLAPHGVQVVAGADRVAAAGRALAEFPETDIFILDDAFQHRQVHRDLDLVLIDATRPFGFDHLLPRGLLREPPGNLARADAVIVTRADQVDAGPLAALDGEIERLTGRPPIAHAAHSWTGYLDHADQPRPLDHLTAARVVGVCGIANPAAFERSLRRHAPRTLAVRSFPDHHHYTAAGLSKLIEGSTQGHPPDAVVTTAKDWVKWRALTGTAEYPVPVYRPVLRMAFLEGEDRLHTLISSRSGDPPPQGVELLHQDG